MIWSEHMKSCLTAQMCFMHFKGPGPFKKNVKIGGNVDELKVHPQNVRFQNARFQNVWFQNVRFQNVRFTKC